MKLSYDRKNDSLYIRFQDAAVASSEDVADGVLVDLASNGEAVGIEVLGIAEWPERARRAILKVSQPSS